MEGQYGITRSIIDEIHSWNIQGDEIEGEIMVLLEVSLMNFILRIFQEIKWKVNLMFLEVSLMKFIIGISKEMK